MTLRKTANYPLQYLLLVKLLKNVLILNVEYLEAVNLGARAWALPVP
jgi:hypothetical protein